MKHPYAEVLTEWLKDTSKKLQLSTGGAWVDVKNMMFVCLTDMDYKWRLGPERVTVGRHSWNMPLVDLPPNGGHVWTFTHTMLDVYQETFRPREVDAVRLGYAHLTKQAAEEHRNALHYINRGDIL